MQLPQLKSTGCAVRSVEQQRKMTMQHTYLTSQNHRTEAKENSVVLTFTDANGNRVSVEMNHSLAIMLSVDIKEEMKSFKEHNE
jgi:hypothetical protein